MLRKSTQRCQTGGLRSQSHNVCASNSNFVSSVILQCYKSSLFTYTYCCCMSISDPCFVILTYSWTIEPFFLHKIVFWFTFHFLVDQVKQLTVKNSHNVVKMFLLCLWTDIVIRYWVYGLGLKPVCWFLKHWWYILWSFSLHFKSNVLYNTSPYSS